VTIFTGNSNTHESGVDLDGLYPAAAAAADDDNKCGGT
jgi:hypothetical protein